MTSPLRTTTLDVPPTRLAALGRDARSLSFWAENAAPVGLVWVMRGGLAVAERRATETDGDELVALITGAKAA